MNEEELEKLIIDYVNSTTVVFLVNTQRIVKSDTELEEKIRKTFWKMIDEGIFTISPDGVLCIKK